MATKSNRKPYPLEGSPDETLLWLPIADRTSKHMDDVTKHVNALWEKYETISDDRLLALIGALYVETSLDIFLASFIKEFKEIKQDQAFTFSIKVKLAKAMRLIPVKILRSCELIGQVRNEFAHNLVITNFNDLKLDRKNKLKSYLLEFTPNTKKTSNLLLTYKKLVSKASTGLLIYSGSLEILQSHMWTLKFKAQLIEYILNKDKETDLCVSGLCPETNPRRVE